MSERPVAIRVLDGGDAWESQSVDDCQSLRSGSPRRLPSPVDENACQAYDNVPFVKPYLSNVSKYCHPNVYFNKARSGIYSRYSMCDWHSSLASNKDMADKQLRRSQICRADCKGTIRQTDGGSKIRQCNNSKRLGDRAFDISHWKNELLIEIKEMETETLALTDQRTVVEKLLADIRSCLEISEKCLFERERRIGVDLCRDEVERSLTKEVNAMRCAIDKLEKLVDKTTIQLKVNRAALNDADKDARDKHHAQQIDERVHRLRTSSVEVSNHDGVEYNDNTVTTEKTWLKFTLEDLCRCQREREKSALLRGQMEAASRQAALDIWKQVQLVNRKFAVRVMETNDARKKLLQRVERATRERDDMADNIAEVKKAIAEKDDYIRVCQTRLEQRLRRNNAELCHDSPMIGLQREVASLKKEKDVLQAKLYDAELSLSRVVRTLSILQSEVAIKFNSLDVDSDKCSLIRRSMHIDPCIGVAFALPRCQYDNLQPIIC